MGFLLPTDSQRRLNQMDLRLRILQILYWQPGYTINQEELLLALYKQGHAISRDRLYVELGWLDQVTNALVYRKPGRTCVVTLTNAGLDIIRGVMVIDGIRRPLPDELLMP